jgi:hypothetical protein
MEAVLNLIREVCRLHRESYIRATDAAGILHRQGFRDVSMKFVKAIYKQLSREAEKRVTKLNERAENALYYEITTEKEELSVWSERYLLLYPSNSPDSDHYEIEVFDTFNDKSA